MQDGRQRGQRISNDNAARFKTTLNLARPTRIRIVAVGPLSNPDSANEVSATQWVIPGKHLTGGDGWLLEMPGLSVTAESSIASNGDLIVIAKVTMMCGCPIEPNGLWDANDYEVADTSFAAFQSGFGK